MTQQTINNYSGAQMQGLNVSASYDRVYLTGKYTSLSEVVIARRDALQTLQTTNRTRVVGNMHIPVSVMQEITKNPGCIGEGTIEALYEYPKSTNRAGYANLILGYNSRIRTIQDHYLNEIRNRVTQTINENGFNLDMQIQRIQELIDHSYRFTFDIDAQQLYELWQDTFGWSLEQVQIELQQNNQSILGLVDVNNNLISCAMISQGESTERATRRGLQRRGLIQPLLLVLHAANIRSDMIQNNNITPITCEARYDRSVRVGAQIGMTLNEIYGVIGVHQNHVTIGGSVPDEWNTHHGIINNMQFSQLRSFVTMYLTDQMYDEQNVRRILESARIR